MRMLMTLTIITFSVGRLSAGDLDSGSPPGSCAELLATALRHAGMSQDQSDTVLTLVAPFLSESKIVGAIDIAGKVSIARDYERALQQAKENPTDDNLRAFAEAYNAKRELQRYERFVGTLMRFLPTEETAELGRYSVNEAEEPFHPIAGLHIQTLTRDTAASLGMPIGIMGIVVTAVEEDSPGDRAGLTSGIVIESVDHRLVEDAEAFLVQMENTQPGDQLLIGYWHPGQDAWERRMQIIRLTDSDESKNDEDGRRVNGSVTPSRRQMLGGISTAFPDAGLFSYYTLEEGGETARDSLGMHDAQNVGAEIDSEGILGQSYRFSRYGQTVDTGIDLAGDEFTLSMWIKRDEDSQPSEGVAGTIGTTDWGKEGFVFAIGVKIVAIDLWQDNRRIMSLRADVPAFSGWNHFVWSYRKGGPTRIYFNGELAGEYGTSPPNPTRHQDRFHFGRSASTNYRQMYLKGLIDEVGLWNRELSTDEITGLYNEGRGLPYRNLPPQISRPTGEYRELKQVDAPYRVFMGTFARVVALAPNETSARNCITAALQRQRRIDELLGSPVADSELNRINRQAFMEPVCISEETFDLLQKAKHLSELSGAGFDVTIGATSYEKLLLDPQTRSVRFLLPEMKLDLAEIAKGYAVDQTVEAMRQSGAAGGMVDIGGTVMCFGVPPTGQETWRIGLSDPRSESEDAPTLKLLLTLKVMTAAVATSNGHRSLPEIERQAQHNVAGSQSDGAERELASVTIIGPNAVSAVALATAVRNLGLERGIALIQRLPDTEAILIPHADDAEPVLTSGASAYIK